MMTPIFDDWDLRSTDKFLIFANANQWMSINQKNLDFTTSAKSIQEDYLGLIILMR